MKPLPSGGLPPYRGTPGLPPAKYFTEPEQSEFSGMRKERYHFTQHTSLLIDSQITLPAIPIFIMTIRVCYYACCILPSHGNTSVSRCLHSSTSDDSSEEVIVVASSEKDITASAAVIIDSPIISGTIHSARRRPHNKPCVCFGKLRCLD